MIYVCEYLGHRVSRWAPGAKCGDTVVGGRGEGFETNRFAFPRSIFVDTEGIMYISEEFAHRVSRWTSGASSGEVVAGGRGEGDAPEQLNHPFGVFVVDS